MIRLLAELELFCVLVELLMRPHGIASLSQLCRLTRQGDDYSRRALAKLEEYFHGALTYIDRHRLQLTPLGRKLYPLAQEIRALAQNNGQEEAEVVSVEMDLVFFDILPQILPLLLEVCGLVRFRFSILDLNSVKENIASKLTTVGVALVDEGESEGTETAVAKVRLVALLSPTHRLGNSSGPLAAADLREDDRVFLTGRTATLPGIKNWLAGVPAYNLVECDSLVAIRNLTGMGIGILPDLAPAEQCNGFVKRPLADNGGLSVCFFQPKKNGGLPDAAQTLLDAIRNHFVEKLDVVETIVAEVPPENGVENGSLKNHNHIPVAEVVDEIQGK